MAGLALLRRRAWSVCLCLFAGWMVGLALAHWLPPRYRAHATLLWTPRAGNPAASLLDRAGQVLRPDRLAPVLAAYPTFGLPRRLTAQALSRRLLADIRPQLPAGAENGVIFDLSLSARQPDLAAAMLRSIVALFTQPAAAPPRPAGTTPSPSPALQRARAQLAAARTEWNKFQASHLGFSPAQAASDAALQATLRQELAEARQAWAQAKAEAARQMQSLAALPPPHAPAPSSPPPSDLALTKLHDLEAQLTQLRKRYTENYPGVQRLESEIAVLRRQLPEHPPAPPTPAADTAEISAWNDLVAQLKANRALAERQVAASQKRIAALEKQSAAVELRLRAAPEWNRQAAALQQALQQAQTAVQVAQAPPPPVSLPNSPFVVLRAPSLPLRPYFPDPFLFGIAGLLAGLAAGIEWAQYRDRHDARLWDEMTAARWCEAPLLPGIPPLLSRGERRWRTARSWLETGAMALLFGLLVAGNVMLYLRR